MAFAGDASAILTEAWRPPCLAYAPDYLRFHCGFPTSLPPAAFAAYQADVAIGFVAATGRVSSIGEMYLSSFLALRPGSVPSVAIALVRQEVRMLKEIGRPMLVFAQTGSVGEYLLRCLDSLGARRVPMGEYRVHMAMPKTAPGDVRVQRITPEAWSRDADSLRDDTLLSPVFDAPNLSHFASDPVGRSFLRAEDTSGRLLAVAMQGRTTMRTATGTEQIPTLHYVRLAEQCPEALSALLAFAKDASNPVVLVPNTAGIASATAQAARLRATGSAFAAYLCRFGVELDALRGTEFEVV